MNKTVTLKEANEWFRANGITKRQWAREKGFAYSAVIDVLRGHCTGNFGESHKIAVALRIK